ncbi:unnamed protein product [Psylliodes chrysocephalus]|uniref:Uncharacterized protein n=1 Tax=Psylliodes chrysocephalus TaxID=3402493 RepID=A0A9P0D0V3_9CUCU|nr:unnamed protein product [Psylliodes chrysocephala]
MQTSWVLAQNVEAKCKKKEKGTVEANLDQFSGAREKAATHRDSVILLTGHSKPTVIDWFNMCREVCRAMASQTVRGQIVGAQDVPVQIDEARFAGLRKYNRCRMLQSPV